jgi:hypothetical protein
MKRASEPMAGRYFGPVATRANDPAPDPIIQLIEDVRPRLSMKEWLAPIDEHESVDLGISAAELVAEARAEEGLL